MALSRVKTWIAGETLTAADLNAEFSNILDNPLSLISPLSSGLDFDGNVITLDSDADTTITADTDDRIDFALSGTDLFRMDGTATTPVNGLTLIARATGSKPSLQALTSDANEGLDLRDDNGNEILILSSVASAANEITITAAAAGNDVAIAATGDDTDISLDLQSKNSGSVKVNGTAFGALATNNSVDGTEIVIGSDAQGDVLYYNGSAWARLGAGTNGDFLQTQGAGANPQWATVGGFTLETIVDATNGGADDLTEIDFTGISANAKEIVIMFDQVSLSGTNTIRVQLGDSGGFEVTGYDGSHCELRGTPSFSAYSSGFDIVYDVAADYVTGKMTLTLMDSSTNLWIEDHLLHDSGDNFLPQGAGRKALSGTLTQVRVTVSGANTFDGGQVNILVKTN